MWKHWILLYLYLIGDWSCVLSKEDSRGVQVRLTKKAFDYASNEVVVKRLVEILKGKTFDYNDQSGRVIFELSDTQIKDVQFPSRSVIPVPGVGLQVKVNDAGILVEGKVMYRYKKGWINIGHTIGITARATEVNFQMTLRIGADANGRPTISSENCGGNVGNLDIDFRGGLSWIYKIFSGLIKSRLRKKLNEAICDSTTKAVDNNLKQELLKFAVSKKIDKWAIIDYRLVGAPTFTADYIDVDIKGEFKDVKESTESALTFSNFETDNDASRMVYFWVSEWTVNTAMEVFHSSGKLQFDVHGWDPQVAELTGNLLNTSYMEFVIPSLYKKYPDAAMGILLKSYKAPRCEINKHGVRFFLYAHADLNVKMRPYPLCILGMTLNINVTVAANFQDGNLVVQIKDDTFQFHAEVDPKHRDMVSVWELNSQNSRCLHGVLKNIIGEKINKELKNGHPLPEIDEVDLKDTSIEFAENAVRIVSDVEMEVLVSAVSTGFKKITDGMILL